MNIGMMERRSGFEFMKVADMAGYPPAFFMGRA